MLLRFFRINDPYRLLGLLLLLIIFSLPAFLFPAVMTLQELKQCVIGEAVSEGKWMYVQIIDPCAPLMAGILGVMNGLMGRYLPTQHILALILIFFQASYFAILLINNKAYNDNTYVPALIFGVLCFISFDQLSFSPELIGSTLLLLALNNLFKEIEFRVERDEIILNLGLYLGLASLIIFSYVLYLFGTVLILLLFTRLTFRKVFLLLFGFILPHALLLCLYYFRGEVSALWEHFYLPNLWPGGEFVTDGKSLLLLIAVPALYFGMSLFMLNREAHFTKYQSQLFQVMFQWLLIGIVYIFIAKEVTPHTLFVFIPPLVYFISHYLLLMRRKWLADLMLWFLLISILSINFLSHHDYIKKIQYSSLFPKETIYGKNLKGKRIMILANDLSVWKDNSMAGYFLDWKLSSPIFEQPNFYENVLLVAEAFTSDPPEVVIDPDQRLAPFFERIPALRNGYVKDGIYYRKKP